MEGDHALRGLFPRPAHPAGRLAVDLACGAAAGAVATFAMDRTSKWVGRLPGTQPPPNPIEDAREPATEKLARRIARPFGIALDGDRKRRAGQAVHWSFGTLSGASFGAMHGRVPYASSLFGLTFGLGLFILGDEVVVPALKLAPGPTQVPIQTHFKALLQHLIYGATAEATFRALSHSPV